MTEQQIKDLEDEKRRVQYDIDMLNAQVWGKNQTIKNIERQIEIAKKAQEELKTNEKLDK